VISVVAAIFALVRAQIASALEKNCARLSGTPVAILTGAVFGSEATASLVGVDAVGVVGVLVGVLAEVEPVAEAALVLELPVDDDLPQPDATSAVAASVSAASFAIDMKALPGGWFRYWLSRTILQAGIGGVQCEEGRATLSRRCPSADMTR
jgi:hypothetical protein